MIKKFCGYCGNPLGSVKNASSIRSEKIGGDPIAYELKLQVAGEEVFFVTPGSDTLETFYLIKIADGGTSLSSGGYFSQLKLNLVGDDPNNFRKENFENFINRSGFDLNNVRNRIATSNYLQAVGGIRLLEEDSERGTMARILATFLIKGDLAKALKFTDRNKFQSGADIKGNPSGAGTSIGRSSQPEIQGDEALPELLEMPPGEAFVNMMGERSVKSLLSKGYETLAKIQNGSFKNAVSAEMIHYLKAKKINSRAHDIFKKEKDFKSLLLLIVLTNKVSKLKGTKWNTIGGEEVAEVEQISAPGELKNFDLGNGKKAGLYFVGIENV